MATYPLEFDERLFHLIVQASPAGMLISDEQGLIVIVNNKALELFGYEEDQLLGSPVERLIPAAHRPTHASHRARYMSQPKSRSMAAGRDLFAVRADGSEFPVDISLHPLDTDVGTYILANVLDATERRQAAQATERRHANERLLLLGQLAGGVAHEIRTPLCVIRNDVYFLQTLRDQLGADGAECIDEINDAVGKANRIVSELLDFTRDPPSCPKPVPVSAILAEALHDFPIPSPIKFQCALRSRVDEGVFSAPAEVAPGVGGGLDQVLIDADAEQIARVLTNLFRNAVQAMQGVGQLWFQVSVDPKSHEVVLQVADSGPGIADDQLESIFEPLFTTKPTGTGLGLAIARRYARRNHGELEVIPQGGRSDFGDSNASGACFRLTLPWAGPP